jgi:MYXO-CTERM domain-containing protein
LKAALAVFEGRVEKLSAREDGRISATLGVVRAWKGVDRERLALATPAASDCGVRFERGQSYLLFAVAEKHGDGLATTRCTGTKPMSDAGDDLDLLGMGATPFEPRELAAEPASPQPPARGGCASCAAGGGDGRTALPWALLAAAWAWRSARRKP